jgi:16S rRNA (uracil1498-N3)-methyltransferase
VLPAAAHAFVTDLSAPVLTDEDDHHLFRVLRLRPGELVTVADGAGRWRRCVVRDGRRGLEPETEIVCDQAPSPPVTIAFAVPKAERPEWIVQKLTEVGVDRIVPMTTAHTVVRWEGDRAARAVERLRDVARAAAMQARRSWLPEVADVTGFADALADVGAAGALAQAGGDALGMARPAVLVGPEGGWSAEELAAAPATVGLGPTVLRAETAALAAAVRLCALRDPV